MLTPSRQLTDAEKLRKVISELVDTERAYVKVMFNISPFMLWKKKNEKCNIHRHTHIWTIRRIRDRLDPNR